MVGHGVNDFSKQMRKGIPFVDEYPEDKSIRVYGVAHCGALGCRNAGGLDNMKKTWEVIAKDLKEIES